jgi:Arc/MetJ-type ribon-helix-helix transcriptional regulator
MKTFQVTLPDEFAAFVDRVLAEKQWDTVDDLVMAALLRLQEEVSEAVEPTGDEVKKAVRVGIEQADRGELTDGPAVFQRMRDKLEAARKQPT